MPNTCPLHKTCTEFFARLLEENTLRGDPELLFPACHARGIQEGTGCPPAKELCCQQLATAPT